MIGILRAFGALMFNNTSTFSPKREDQEDAASPSEEPRCTILAIDDDPVYLDTLRPLLREEGFNVLTCTSSPKALNMLQYGQRDIRVVLLDYNMPQLNGAETLRYLRQLNSQIKIIALTGVDIRLLPPSFHDGVDGFLQKPFRSNELVRVINSLLGAEAKPAAAGSS